MMTQRRAVFPNLLLATLAATLACLPMVKLQQSPSSESGLGDELVGIDLSKLEASRMVQELGAVRTQVPVIGVLTQVLRDYKRFGNQRHLHLASSYVKWIESAGAQVLPILLNEDDEYYERVFSMTNGLLLPGGDNLLDPKKSTPMMMAARKLYKLAVDANDRGDYYPIWGTCLGMELLSVLSSNKNVLNGCTANNIALKMDFVERGKMFAPNSNANLRLLEKLDYSRFIKETLESQPVAYHYHHKCLTDEGLRKANLENFYRPLAYSRDINELKFISIFEAIRYPFYGVQFHPEKPAFEFTKSKHNLNVPHSRESIEVSRYLADFFIRQAQRNGHHTANWQDISRALIYAYQPMYTGLLNDLYEQRYLFPFSDRDNCKSHLELLQQAPQGVKWHIVDCPSGKVKVPEGVSPLRNPFLSVEFLDHVPNQDEVIDEEVL